MNYSEKVQCKNSLKRHWNILFGLSPSSANVKTINCLKLKILELHEVIFRRSLMLPHNMIFPKHLTFFWFINELGRWSEGLSQLFELLPFGTNLSFWGNIFCLIHKYTRKQQKKRYSIIKNVKIPTVFEKVTLCKLWEFFLFDGFFWVAYD